MKVLIIGLDGMAPELLEAWVADGGLPNLGRLMREGVAGRLGSVVPALTYPAWSSFATGMHPGNTGIYEFYRRETDTYRERMFLSHDLASETLWESLNRHGKRVGLIGFPNTYPARTLDGFTIAGIVAPDTSAPGFCFPADLFERHGLERSTYRIEGRPLREVGDDYAGYVHELKNMIEQRAHVALTLMAREPWDCLIVHEIGTDAVAHAMWRFMDPRSPVFVPDAPAVCRNAIREVYQVADRMVGDLVKAAGGDVLTVVLSDHGNGPTTRAINPNILLREADLLAVKTGRLRILLEDHVARRCSRRIAQAVRATGGIAAALPGPVRRVADAVFERIVATVPPLARKLEDIHEIAVDYRRTRAYAFGNRGGIYVNLRGREPEGIVRPEDYEMVRTEVLRVLRELTDDDGRLVFPRACLRESVYRGHLAHLAPDVLTSDNDDEGYFFNFSALDGAPALDAVRPYCSGMHTHDGVLLIHGPGIKPGARLNDAEIVDVAPTILHALGLPVATGIDGRVLESALVDAGPVAFSNADAARRPTSSLPSEEEEKILHQRLKDLGYVE